MGKSKGEQRKVGHNSRHNASDPVWEEDDADWLTNVCGPWRKRWAIDTDAQFARRFKDNEGWDNDRTNEVRRDRKGFGSTRRFPKRYYDDSKNE